MLNKKFIAKLKSDYQNHDIERRQIIAQSNIILHDAKRAIFATHRQDLKTANSSLIDLKNQINSLQKKFGYTRVNEEGAYKAAIEEFVEAQLFYDALANKKISNIIGLKLDVTAYLGGLSDLTGELVRHATNLAAAGKTKAALDVKKIIDEVMSELVDFDMTSYLRTKYDQAKNNLRKIEQINYELSLRQ